MGGAEMALLVGIPFVEAILSYLQNSLFVT